MADFAFFVGGIDYPADNDVAHILTSYRIFGVERFRTRTIPDHYHLEAANVSEEEICHMRNHGSRHLES